MLILNKNIKLILNYVVGPVVFCLVLYAIWHQVQQQPDWRQSLMRLRGASGTAISAVLGLMLVNWGIEARKWQLALSSRYKISFARSCKAVFSGTSVALFTPNRSGEYMGRILYLPEGERIPAIALTLVCSLSQLMITLAAGTGGLCFLANHFAGLELAGWFWVRAGIGITAGAFTVLTIIYFRLSWLVSRVEKIQKIEKYISYIRVLEGFDATVLLKILSWSACRFAVFTAQYYLLFRVFTVELNGWQTFWSVSVVFLIMAVVPSVALLTELGVRWEASLGVIGLFSSNTAGILASSLAVWIINLVLPALIGSVLIAGLKIFTDKDELKSTARKT